MRMWVQFRYRGGRCYRTVDVCDWRDALRVLRFERSQQGWVRFTIGRYR